MTTNIRRHQTAIRRHSLSRPVALLLENSLLDADATFFDYGCGRGDDLRVLKALGYEVEGWDPVHRAHVELRSANVVNLGFVVNVIEDPEERADALREAWSFTEDLLVVAARLDWEARSVSGRNYQDGVLTRRETFQKFFTQEELRSWIDTKLAVRSVAAGPGIFYVFRDETRVQRYLASRVRRRMPRLRRPEVSEDIYWANQDILQPLQGFLLTRGRPPAPDEIDETEAIRDSIGGISRAQKVILHAVGNDVWAQTQEAAANDLLVYLALSAFNGRPKFTQLPTDIQLDVKAFSGSYRRACANADRLLFRAGDQSAIERACRDSAVGKLTREALYVHISALGEIDPLLRVYEGCGRALTGTVEGANIIKLNRIEPKVTYLAYPKFDNDPHPDLTFSVRADLRRLDVRFTDFREADNPPILHRKELFVGLEYPGREKFARLTDHEERRGLLDQTQGIGNRNGWNERLRQRGVRVHGHRLMKFANAGCDI